MSLGQLAAESIPKTLQCITVKLTQEWGNFHNYKGEFKKQLKENTSMEVRKSLALILPAKVTLTVFTTCRKVPECIIIAWFQIMYLQYLW